MQLPIARTAHPSLNATLLLALIAVIAAAVIAVVLAVGMNDGSPSPREAASVRQLPPSVYERKLEATGAGVPGLMFTNAESAIVQETGQAAVQAAKADRLAAELDRAVSRSARTELPASLHERKLSAIDAGLAGLDFDADARESGSPSTIVDAWARKLAETERNVDSALR